MILNIFKTKKDLETNKSILLNCSFLFKMSVNLLKFNEKWLKEHLYLV